MEKQSTTENVEIDMIKLSHEEQEKYAETFSEGSKSLKELLKYLWKNGINTFASCAGHNHKTDLGGGVSMEQSYPYIFIDILSLTDDELKNLLIRLSVPKTIADKVRFDFSVSKDRITKDKHERTGLSINFKAITDENFSNLLKQIIAVKEKEVMKFSEIEKDFNKEGSFNRIKAEDVKNFIKSAIRLKNVSLKDYQEQQDAEEFGQIILSYFNSLGMLQEIEDNHVKRPLTLKDDNGILRDYFIVKGYATKCFDDNYYTTTTGDDIVQLTTEQAEKLKKLEINNLINKSKFNYEEFNLILEKLESINIENLNI